MCRLYRPLCLAGMKGLQGAQVSFIGQRLEGHGIRWRNRYNQAQRRRVRRHWSPRWNCWNGRDTGCAGTGRRVGMAEMEGIQGTQALTAATLPDLSIGRRWYLFVCEDRYNINAHAYLRPWLWRPLRTYRSAPTVGVGSVTAGRGSYGTRSHACASPARALLPLAASRFHDIIRQLRPLWVVAGQ